MATKNIKEEPKATSVEKKGQTVTSREKKIQKYFSGIGRRKLAVARVRIFENNASKDEKKEINIEVNKKPYEEYFTLSELREIVISPLRVCGEENGTISVRVKGGGIRGQADAVRLGMARALVVLDENFRKPLRDSGFLTRDDRIVERKKAGFRKARRAPQFSKR